MSTSTKVKTPKGGPIERLYLAADEIVSKTRAAFRDAGQSSPEIRLPILIHGTDMRITIQAGPQIAARNAIERAQMQASGKPVEPMVDMSRTLQTAKALLGIMAADAEAKRRSADQGSQEWHQGNDEAKRCLETIEQLTQMERLI